MHKFIDMLKVRWQIPLAIGASVILALSVIGILAMYGANRPSQPGGQGYTSTGGSITFQVTATSISTSNAQGSTSGTHQTGGRPGTNGTSPISSPNTSQPTPGSTEFPGTPTTTPAPSISPTVPSTPPPVPSAPYDAMAIGPTSPVTIASGGVITIYAIVKNTGNMPWASGWDFKFVCTSNCMGASPLPGNDVAPGQSWQYDIQLYEPSTWSVGTYVTHWTMEHNNIPFGHDIALQLAVTHALPLLSQGAPSCGNPAGVSWNWQNAAGGNTIACTGSGLMVQQASGSSPEADVTAIPGSYDPNYFNARMHVQFSGSSSSTYAGFVFHVPSSNSQCGGMRFQINSAGAWRIAEYFLSSSGVCTTDSWTGSVSAAFDYDLLIYVAPNGTALAVNGQGVLSGGFVPTGGLTGLAVWDSAGTSTQVTFSAFEVADPRVTRSDQFVISPA